MSYTNVAEAELAAAHRATREGRLADARRLWAGFLQKQPNHGEALYAAGFVELQSGDFPKAAILLERAAAVRPGDPLSRMTLAVARREAGDAAGERDALVDALAAEPYYLPALLSLGAWQERNALPRAAAVTYGNALKIVPDDRSWPDDMRPHLAHARQVANRNGERLHAVLRERLTASGADMTERVAECLSIMAGRSAPYVQSASTLLVPRLPAIPFYERAEFPFLAQIEAEAAAIKEEVLASLGAMEGFAPYVRYAPGTPVNQWAELNHSPKWSSLFLWENGLPVEENQRRFPKTAAALERLPLAGIDGFCPTVMLSALAPGAHIPPHTGETNARLIVHLPLVVPPDCSYRVGHEWRRWVEGECLIFDDTLEHEARNDSDRLRLVLIFDIWNPALTAVEREAVSLALGAARAYYAGQETGN